MLEGNRTERSARFRMGQGDPVDAEILARAYPAGVASATAKSGEGEIGMNRTLKGAKRSTVKARTQATYQTKLKPR